MFAAALTTTTRSMRGSLLLSRAMSSVPDKMKVRTRESLVGVSCFVNVTRLALLEVTRQRRKVESLRLHSILPM